MKLELNDIIGVQDVGVAVADSGEAFRREPESELGFGGAPHWSCMLVVPRAPDAGLPAAEIGVRGVVHELGQRALCAQRIDLEAVGRPPRACCAEDHGARTTRRPGHPWSGR